MNVTLSEQQIDWFWANVDEFSSSNGCWLWTGKSKHGFGYGLMTIESRTVGAYKVSWIIHNGPIPEGMGVLHKCDNPPCVNPAHLFLGTQTDNNVDMISKGRYRLPLTLTPELVLKIRKRADAGESHKSIAQDFGICKSNVYYVANRRTWRWVPEAA